MAKRLSRSRATIVKIMAGTAKPGPEVCVRLALDDGLTPVDTLKLLRAAGHVELADLWTRAGYGGEVVSEDDRRTIEKLKATGDNESHLRALIESLAKPPKKRPTP